MYSYVYNVPYLLTDKGTVYVVKFSSHVQTVCSIICLVQQFVQYKKFLPDIAI